MRLCKINGCPTSSRNSERSLFEITTERQEWIKVIQSKQTLDTEKKIYICELHFDPNDLVRNGKNLRPKNGVVPKLGRSSQEESTRDKSNDDEYDDVIGTSLYRTLPNGGNGNVTADMKLVPIGEYRKLCNMSIELIKANKKIDQLIAQIQKKDDIIEKLKTKPTAYAHLTPAQKEVIEILVHGLKLKGTKYSPAVRKFCLRMLFHSSAAYRELRHFFGNNLPTIRTIQRWLQCIDASPGITKSSLDLIAEKAEEYKSRNQQLYICLISDEMSLRKQALWNESTREFDGFSKTINSTNRQDSDKLPLAKDALVFMAVGPNFRTTVAYFLLNGLDSIDRAAYTQEIIKSIDATGAKTISLTGDGLHANKAVARLLGADFTKNRTYFPRPSNPTEKIYVIFDPCHMIKLLRKYLAKANIRCGKDRFDWGLIEKLVSQQDSDNFSLGNRLSRNHIRWQDNKMKVILAVQIFSNGLADALEQLCDDEYEGFVGCQKFVQFIRLVNDIFDIMNYGEGKKTDNNFKQPLCSSTIDKFSLRFGEFTDFISQLTIDVKSNKKIYRRKAITQIGFMGLLVNVHSTLGIFEDYIRNHVTNGPPVFYPFQYSQDHLETYFSLVRGSLGCNVNPNVQQFQSAYRKLLFSTPHISGAFTNCNTEFPDALLEVSSMSTNVSNQLHLAMATSPEEIELNLDYYTLLNTEVSPYDQHVHAITASTVEFKIIKNILARSVAACQDCLNVFNENHKTPDSLIAKKIDRGESIAYPCTSTMNIIKVCEEIGKLLPSNDYKNFTSIAKSIFHTLEIESLYESSNFNWHENKTGNTLISHKEEFILGVLEKYMHEKSKKNCARISIEEQREATEKRQKRRQQILDGK